MFRLEGFIDFIIRVLEFVLFLFFHVLWALLPEINIHSLVHY